MRQPEAIAPVHNEQRGDIGRSNPLGVARERSSLYIIVILGVSAFCRTANGQRVLTLGQQSCWCTPFYRKHDMTLGQHSVRVNFDGHRSILT